MQKIVIKLKGGYVPQAIEDVHTYFQEINRGKGVHKTSKGKGSYNRNSKHKGKDQW